MPTVAQVARTARVGEEVGQAADVGAAAHQVVGHRRGRGVVAHAPVQLEVEGDDQGPGAGGGGHGRFGSGQSARCASVASPPPRSWPRSRSGRAGHGHHGVEGQVVGQGVAEGEAGQSPCRGPAQVADVMEVDPVEAVHVEHPAQGALAVPGGVLGVHAGVAAEPVDEIADVEGVGRGEHETAARGQVPADAGQESVDVVQVLDELPGEDDVEGPAEVEVLGVGQADVVAGGLELADDLVIQVDADQVVGVACQQAVQPVVAAVA